MMIRKADEENPFAGAIARADRTKHNLTILAGEMLTEHQVADRLSCTPQAVEKKRAKNELLAVQSDVDWMYPAFQFENEDVVKGIKHALTAYEGHDSWWILDSLLAPDDTLDGRSLLEAIRDKDLSAVQRCLLQDQSDGYA
jgi:hypothetical protein